MGSVALADPLTDKQAVRTNGICCSSRSCADFSRICAIGRFSGKPDLTDHAADIAGTGYSSFIDRVRNLDGCIAAADHTANKCSVCCNDIALILAAGNGERCFIGNVADQAAHLVSAGGDICFIDDVGDHGAVLCQACYRACVSGGPDCSVNDQVAYLSAQRAKQTEAEFHGRFAEIDRMVLSIVIGSEGIPGSPFIIREFNIRANGLPVTCP